MLAVREKEGEDAAEKQNASDLCPFGMCDGQIQNEADHGHQEREWRDHHVVWCDIAEVTRRTPLALQFLCRKLSDF